MAPGVRGITWVHRGAVPGALLCDPEVPARFGHHRQEDRCRRFRVGGRHVFPDAYAERGSLLRSKHP